MARNRDIEKLNEAAAASDKNRALLEQKVDDLGNMIETRINLMETTQNGTLLRIETQVNKTNGRVSTLEKWQSYVIGFSAGLSLFLVGITIALSVKYLS